MLIPPRRAVASMVVRMCVVSVPLIVSSPTVCVWVGIGGRFARFGTIRAGDMPHTARVIDQHPDILTGRAKRLPVRWIYGVDPTTTNSIGGIVSVLARVTDGKRGMQPVRLGEVALHRQRECVGRRAAYRDPALRGEVGRLGLRRGGYLGTLVGGGRLIAQPRDDKTRIGPGQMGPPPRPRAGATRPQADQAAGITPRTVRTHTLIVLRPFRAVRCRNHIPSHSPTGRYHAYAMTARLAART